MDRSEPIENSGFDLYMVFLIVTGYCAGYVLCVRARARLRFPDSFATEPDYLTK